MSDGEDFAERQLGRDSSAISAAVAGGAVLLRLAGGGGEGTPAESGRLQVLDWAGYGNDGGQAMFAQYVKKHPDNKPQFTYMTNESDAWRRSTRA